jgi:hypothetical protein
MEWVTFAKFLKLIKEAKRWELEIYDDGFVVSVQEAAGFQRKQYHSPDPLQSDPEEWSTFLNALSKELFENKGEVY